MEIISYVQDNSRARGFRPLRTFSLPELQFRHKERSQAASITANIFSPELKSFSAQKVRSDFSVKSIFKLLGGALTQSGDYIKSNAKAFFIIAASAAAFATISIFSFKLVNHHINHTGPLTLQSDGGDDIEILNKLMANFALEGKIDYDENGKLLDVEVPAVKPNFTQPVTFQTYKVRQGDTISGIAKKFGLTNISTLISVNDIGNVRQLAAGQKLKIPSIDGIVYTVKKGDSLSGITGKYKVSLEQLLDVNELTSETLTAGQQLFLPGAAMDANSLRNAMGELFRMPIAAKFRWSSPYGYRIDPIAGVKSFHTGTDMACPTGTPILAAMSGKVTTTGINRVYGNYVIIDHGNGYQTLYAHMSKIIASKGQWVSQGTRIGLVGSTGYSTGPHLHFTVYKKGKLVDPMTVLK
ncbi:peptidoglycan DD-metalloendopeptidase family protein [Treponema bryantii]|uniref:peptidoglycan DD-metalloendopeptidase family protein n=1 Tax=Treponema bryantii TaxID=163 RepID=UPI0003B5FB9A|nr:M23 family metallopeptidase [Treponema bryantii]